LAVVLGHDVIDEGEKLLDDLVACYQRHGASVVGAMEVERSQITSYGAVAPAEEVEPGLYRMADVVEKPAPEEAPSNLAVIGRYVLHPEIFEALRVTEPGAGGEIQLSDALKHLVHHSERGVLAYAFTGTRYDAGDKNDYLRATVELAAGRDDIGPSFVAFMRRFLADLDRAAGR
jgi:UTP--glucose-1-phosphate uridylyltransferase